MPCAGFEVLAGVLTLGGLEDDYSLFSPLTGLRGRNGGLSLKCRWEALCAIGVKVVSLKSTLSGFWVVLGLHKTCLFRIIPALLRTWYAIP